MAPTLSRLLHCHSSCAISLNATSFLWSTRCSEKLHDGTANNICLLEGNEINEMLLNGSETFVTFPTNEANEDPSTREVSSRVSESGSSHFFLFRSLFWLFGFFYIRSKHPRVSMQFVNRIALLTYDYHLRQSGLVGPTYQGLIDRSQFTHRSRGFLEGSF